jgi:isopenicillin N synthase-like dioxygenase
LQWPKEESIPGFKDVLTKYLLEVQTLSYHFVDILADALGLPVEKMRSFYDTDELMQHRGKVSTTALSYHHQSTHEASQIVKYPDDVTSDQGVGPHYDAGFITIVRP